MMWSSLGLFLFIIALTAEPTKAADENESYDDKHGNHSFVQPRQSSLLDESSLNTATIYTPNYPKRYPSRSLVPWDFKATGTFELFCPVFKLLPRKRIGNCIDYLEVKCTYENDVSIHKYCGSELSGYENKITIVTDPPSVIRCELTFKSSKKRNSRYIGFNCTASSPPDIPVCNCGVHVPPVAGNDRIGGGSSAVDNQIPWEAAMVNYGASIHDKKDLICGGTLINNQYVLTAASCTYNLPGPNAIQIFLGEWCWNITSPGLLRYDVIRIIQHINYNPNSSDNDISLLMLERTVDFIRTNIRPVCLPSISTDAIPNEDDVYATISGFGRQSFQDAALPNCLQFAKVPMLNNTLCQSLYPEENITANMLCAGYPGVGTIDAFQGDSGGPITTNATCKKKLVFVVIGFLVGVIVGLLLKSDYPGPGVHTRVTEYIEWIHKNTDWSIGNTCPPPC